MANKTHYSLEEAWRLTSAAIPKSSRAKAENGSTYPAFLSNHPNTSTLTRHNALTNSAVPRTHTVQTNTSPDT